MDLALLVSGCIALVGVVLAAVFLPRTSASIGIESLPGASSDTAVQLVNL
jgi:hypothetical protein